MTKHKYKKSLGQHFLTNEDILLRITQISNIQHEDIVLEIGPGTGNLTKHILKAKPKKLIVVEKDIECKESLQELQCEFKNLEIIFADIMNLDLDSIISEQTKIIANLPYYISTSILLKLLQTQNINFMTLMFQDEVAKRITSLENSKDYGALSVVTNLLSQTKYQFLIEAMHFTPPPKSNSAVISSTPYNVKQHDIKDIRHLQQITKQIFSYRRKTIKKILSSILNYDFQELTTGTAIQEKDRPENISIKDFYHLSNVIKKLT